ncbi:hypothetical protein ROZALSC1DRAFT_25330 [Rozella allomycis CSF55]|uniref:Uncharacterized protein n=1 Tax=Rozella allomycis (strain CSF55) TaxID=988480 RepID=A0A4P9YBF2_ROZAC|nr:hypothetical protein ROZALSC1DRAFT_25330 [Rozella allomycis CSF55]
MAKRPRRQTTINAASRYKKDSDALEYLAQNANRSKYKRRSADDDGNWVPPPNIIPPDPPLNQQAEPETMSKADNLTAFDSEANGPLHQQPWAKDRMKRFQKDGEVSTSKMPYLSRHVAYLSVKTKCHFVSLSWLYQVRNA